MAAGQQPKYGTLVHQQLRVGHEAASSGERVRPQYLGSVLTLGGANDSLQASTRLTAEAQGSN